MDKVTSKLFKILSNDKRLKIIKTLVDIKELSVEAISRRIKSSYKSTSKHLLILETNGIVQRAQRKRWGLYSIEHKRRQALKRVITAAKYYFSKV